MSEKERLELIINSFSESKKSKFAKQLDISAQVVNNWLNRGLSKDAIEKISRRWTNINIGWLISGEGEMLIQKESSNVKQVDHIEGRRVMVRFFSVTPTATFQEFCYDSDEEADTIPVQSQPNEDLDESFCVFEIFGNSMAPQIQSKAQVLCEEVSTTRWHMLRDCVVVIAYADRFVIKRIEENRLDSSNYLVLKSDNPDYPSKETIQLSDIRCIYRAIRIISQQIF